MANPEQLDTSPAKIFAQRLRNQRIGAEMSAVELAEKAQLAQSNISDYESGSGTIPRTSTLKKLARALGVRNWLVWFEREDAARKDIVVFNHNNLKYIDLGDGLSYGVFPDEVVASEKLFPAFVTIPPHTSCDEVAHAGEDLCVVLEGEIQIKIRDAIHTVKAGHVAHYRARLNHSVSNNTDNYAKIFVVKYPAY